MYIVYTIYSVYKKSGFAISYRKCFPYLIENHERKTQYRRIRPRKIQENVLQVK